MKREEKTDTVISDAYNANLRVLCPTCGRLLSMVPGNSLPKLYCGFSICEEDRVFRVPVVPVEIEVVDEDEEGEE